MIWLIACHPPPPPLPVATPIQLDDIQLLRRLSLDLRGTLPTVEEVSRLENNPQELNVLRDEFLEDERFKDRVVSFFSEQWHTTIDVFDVVYFDYHLDPEEEFTFERSVGEEPLRLIAHVAALDLPWSETVLADYTLANQMLMNIWPLEAQAETSETSWFQAKYTDGRPPVGLLATNGLWWRYTTDDSNMNRSRAAAISRLMLCEDILARPVSFSTLELEDIGTGDASSATLTNPSCLACHSTLDPMASTLFGFWWLSLYSTIEETSYHPEREALGEEYLQTESAYFGEPIDGLADLGPMIANDPRFYSCAVETMAKAFWRRPITPEDRPVLHEHWLNFMNGETKIKSLIRSITDGEEYRIGDFDIEPSPEISARYRSSAMLSPDQLASSVESLTGFRWVVDGFDMMTSDELGFRSLAGGVDGLNTFQPQPNPGITWVFTLQRFSQLAGQYVAENDLDGENPVLLTLVTDETRFYEAAFVQQLRELHMRIFSTPASEEWIEEMTFLWEEVDLMEGPTQAWASVVSLNLRDPRFVFY